MTRKTYSLLLPAFIAIAFGYAWWTQPHIGPPSGQSVIIRSLLISFWLVLLPVLRGERFGAFDWRKFWIGFGCGGAYLLGLVFLTTTPQKAISTVLMALILSGISGLYAATAKNNFYAGFTGAMILWAQLAVGAVAFGAGLIKLNFGM